MQDCTRTKSEDLMEAVPEALKNMLLVMAAKGVLTPTWQVKLIPYYPAPAYAVQADWNTLLRSHMLLRTVHITFLCSLLPNLRVSVYGTLSHGNTVSSFIEVQTRHTTVCT